MPEDIKDNQTSLNDLKSTVDELKEVVEENIKTSQEVLKLSKKINNFVLWQQILSVLKIIIILIPLILGIIYLPPLLDKAFEPYKELLGIKETLNTGNILEKLK